MAEINQFCTEPITCYAQSGTADRLALSPNNNLVYIYRQQNSSWIEESVLSQHDLRVTSIDWAPKTNRIVTCSADRNAYVWIESDQTWKPTLVLLRINRAATCVKWSPNEDKFAVGTAAKLVCICYFESANDWWLSRHIKKPIKSTVTSIDWHPNNVLLSCGSTDYKSRIFSTFIKEVDNKSSLPTLKTSTWLRAALAQNNSSGDPTAQHLDEESIATTGTLVCEFSNSGAWVHDVSFSPDGIKLAWISHDSSISVVDSSDSMTVITLKTRYLPFLSCVWVSNNSIIAAGHDCCPMLFSHQIASQSNQNGPTNYSAHQQAILKFIGRLDRSQKRTEDGQSAMRKFRDLDANADQSTVNGDSCLGTIHQNTIGQVRLYSKSRSVATVGLDGKFVVWSLDPSVL